MSSNEDFEINDGELEQYSGSEEIVIIPDGVWLIGEDAFRDCKSLNSVTIPDSVTEIWDNAFENCSSLSSITIPDSVTSIGWYAFCGCTSLRSVTMSSNVMIRRFIFNGCTNLSSIIVNENNPVYTSIDGIVYDKEIQKLILAPEGIKEPINIPSSVTSIRAYAFEGCAGLSSVNIPDGVTYIGRFAFKNCTNLKSITIPSSVMSIGDGAFEGCECLKEIILKNKELNIKTDWFGSDINIMKALAGNVYPKQLFSELKKEMLGEIVKQLNKYDNSDSQWSALWFKYLKSERKSLYKQIVENNDLLNIMIKEKFLDLKDVKDLISISSEKSLVNVSAVLLEYQNNNFSEGEIIDSTFDELNVDTSSDSYLEKKWTFKKNEDNTLVITNYKGSDLDIVIPDVIGNKSVTSIGKYAFYYCQSLRSISIPDSVITIEDGAFYGCERLSNIIIPDSVITIGNSAFYGCGSLSSINIPDSVTTIGDGAFVASGLSSINIGKSVTSIERSFFDYGDDYQKININVSEDNPNFASIKGVVFDKEIKELILALNVTEDLYIPYGVTTIRDGAVFDFSSFIITIPNSVTIIDEDAFEECYDLCLTTPTRFVDYFMSHECRVIETDD